MSNIGKTKLAASHRLLKQVIKEQEAAHNIAHARDVHKIDRGDSFAPVRVVGGYENNNSHNTEFQKKIKRNDISTRGTDFPERTLFQRQIKSAGSETGVPKNPRRTLAQQVIGNTQPL